jgi:hypothetical protein
MALGKLAYTGGAAAMGVIVAGAAGYPIGKHTTAAHADVAETPRMIASMSGAPPMPGLCVRSQNAVYARIGLAAMARCRQLACDLRGQLAPQRQQRDRFTREMA